MKELLQIKDLSLSFFTPGGEVEALRRVSLSLKKGEVLAVVGESGCGKSVLCKSIIKLLPRSAKIKEGYIGINGVDITRYQEKEMQKIRGKMFSMVFQEPMTALNPTKTVGKQIEETIRIHHPELSEAQRHKRILELMEMVGIDEARSRVQQYPHQLSGGMRQRSVLAIALASAPQLLLADEPTTALDVTTQAQILKVLKDIQTKLGLAILFVSHDLGVVAQIADRVAVMYAGKIVETGTVKEIFSKPQHPYTWGLLQALPYLAKKGEPLYAIPGMPPDLAHPPKGDAFACRNQYALAIDYEKMPPMFKLSDTHYAATWLLHPSAPRIEFPLMQQEDREPFQDREIRKKGSQKLKGQNAAPVLLQVESLTYGFSHHGNRRKVLDQVSFQIRQGEIFGLVGESGCGKSTLARCIMNLYRPWEGRILYQGVDTCDARQFKANRRMLQTSRQLIFQDSTSSLNERMKVVDIISEPMKLAGITPPRGSCRKEAEFQLYHLGLGASCLDRYPPQLSGGMRQRVAIARALTMEPKLLVADEPLASLDVSVQAQLINLFKHLQEEHGFTFLFIAHDLSVVRYLCDRVGVMNKGRLVEVSDTQSLFEAPRHPYTKALLSAIPFSRAEWVKAAE